MLEKALAVIKAGSDKALLQWFDALSDEDKHKFLAELDQASCQVSAAFTQFGDAVIAMADTIRLTTFDEFNHRVHAKEPQSSPAAIRGGRGNQRPKTAP
jgi:hypothetical protein